MRIQMKNAFDKNLCILHSPEYNKVYISVVFPNLLNTSHTKYKFSCGNKSTPGRPQNLVENIFMKYYWTRIPTVLQIIFDNESTIPIVRKLFLRSLPDPYIKYKICCDKDFRALRFEITLSGRGSPGLGGAAEARENVNPLRF